MPSERHLRVLFVVLVLAVLWGPVAWLYLYPSVAMFGSLALLVLGLTVLKHAGVDE